jgi:hypothetical protein
MPAHSHSVKRRRCSRLWRAATSLTNHGTKDVDGRNKSMTTVKKVPAR